MKKLLCSMLAICLLMITAAADVLWEPESSFYKCHADDCELEQRTYWVNSPDGYTTVWDSPGGTAIANLSNGELLHIYYRYQDGESSWGVAECSAEGLREKAVTLNEAACSVDHWLELWVPMGDLVNRYDHQSFLEDHAVLEEERTVSLSGLHYCTYAYPGGPLNFQQTQEMELDNLMLSPIYVDADGREWGHCGYFYGDRNVWFCISDLENPELPVENHDPEFYPAVMEAPELPASGVNASVWVIAAVAAVCGVTAVLIFRMRRKD